ncbi:hypothetical protein [Jeotgalibacillus sp. ET6]|nr:hypothetical protein [Jeotgalibacillus sp. ET6]MDG5471225.1 hypothetical protein [Jeotgalibacillus sp. ET6]
MDKKDLEQNSEEIIEVVTEIDEESWNVIKRLYDGTFKALVDR